jgi:hypothetical protein
MAEEIKADRLPEEWWKAVGNRHFRKIHCGWEEFVVQVTAVPTGIVLGGEQTHEFYFTSLSDAQKFYDKARAAKKAPEGGPEQREILMGWRREPEKSRILNVDMFIQHRFRPLRPCNHTDDDVCTCTCHGNTEGIIVRHIVACCHQCPVCGRMIPSEKMREYWNEG